ncbi:MAG TPA: NTP transferase domain-containing protein [Candidatus Binatia bacterium]
MQSSAYAYQQPTGDISAIILAGGRSSRMGRPKALLPFGEQPLIAHIVRFLKELFADIVIVIAPDQQLPPLPVTLVRDEVAYQGPVSGIYHGLKAAGSDVSFVGSCDMPFLNLSLVSYLCSQIGDHDVVVPYWEGRFQPLLAIYRKSVAPYLQAQLQKGELRPIFLFDKVRTRKVDEEEIRRIDPEGLSFLNMNSPADYQAALERWQDSRGISTAVPVPSIFCTVELFGVARLRAKTKAVSLELPPGANLAQVFLALAERLPTLVGSVIAGDKESLVTGQACNVNGRDFVRDRQTKIRSGDRIFIISADAGG